MAQLLLTHAILSDTTNCKARDNRESRQESSLTSARDEHVSRLNKVEVHHSQLLQQNAKVRAVQELERARDRYRALYDEYRALYEFAPIGYLTLNPRGQITSLNETACRILRMPQHGLIRQSLYRFIHLAEWDTLSTHMQQVFAEQRTCSCELTLRSKTGRGPIKVHLESTGAQPSKPESILVALSDITEQDEVKRKLQDSERLMTIGAASATLVHELGNPLNNILTTIQTMDRQLARPTLQRQAIRRNIRQTESEIARLCTLVDKVRQLTAPEKLHSDVIRLQALIEQALEIATNTLSTRRISIQRELNSRGFLAGDFPKLCEALLNLVSNAVEATPDGGNIILRSYDLDMWLCFEITNSAKPIPPMLDVFEPFVTTKQHGIGIGLTIVKQIVAAHGGLVSYSSTEKETTFRTMLPRQENEEDEEHRGLKTLSPPC